MPEIKGKVALITGASSGIGAATAKYFATLGCHLVLTGRNKENLQTVRSDCIKAGLQEDQVVIMAIDITESCAPAQLVNFVIDCFKKLDILVNCAGILMSGQVIDAPISKYDQVMNVNVRSVVTVTQACLSHLIKSRGSVINVSSVNGFCSFPNVSFYCMSKSALDQFTKCLALEMAPHGVRVNSVNPGVTITNIHRNSGMNSEQYVQFLDHSKTTHALGRVAEPLEVAKAIAFLASDDSSFTTGCLLPVDGGRHLMTPR